MVKLSEIIAVLESEAPFSLQESYDNSGIQVGEPFRDVKKGLICFDVTNEILEQAIDEGCDLVISHHPMIFGGIKKFTGTTYSDRLVTKAIKNDIAVISVHTNLDSVLYGVNHRLATKLGLTDMEILDPVKGKLRKLVTFCPTEHAEKVRKAIFDAGAGVIGNYDSCSYNLDGEGSFRAGELANPYVGEKGIIHFEKETRIETIFPAWKQNSVIEAMFEAHPYEEIAYDIYQLENEHQQVGMGMMGMLVQPMEWQDFLIHVKKNLMVPVVKHSQPLSKPILKVALCGGSGSFLRAKAMGAGADVFLTADVKYHEYFDAGSKIMICDVGHYESEQFTKELLYDILTKKIANFALQISDVDTNPVYYF